MAENAKTPGQIAYEAFYGSFTGGYLEWGDLEWAPGRDAWETAAAAVLQANVTQIT